MLSVKHSNRTRTNWLIYDLTDKFLLNNTHLIGEVVFDFGCGESPYKDFFLQYAKKYVGVDWGSSFHKSTADVIADLNRPLPIDSEQADTIVSLSVLEHLSEPQIMLSEAQRVLKRGGKMLLYVPFQWRVHEAPFDYFRFTPYGLRHIAEKAGFLDVQVYPGGGFFSSWVLKFNYFSESKLGARFPIGLFLRLMLRPIWYWGQVFAPILDKYDDDWNLEAPGYWLVAGKS